MMRCTLSLKWVVALVLLAVAIADVSAIFGYLLPETDKNKEEDKRLDMIHDVASLQGTLEVFFRIGHLDGVRHKVAESSTDPDNKWLLVIDDRMNVIATTDFRWQGKPLDELDLPIDRQRVTNILSTRTATTEIIKVGKILVAYGRVTLPPEANGVRPFRAGAVILAQDLERVQDETRRQAIKSLTILASVIVTGIGLAWFLFHILVTRRTANLLATVTALAEGDLDARTRVAGRDEIGALGSAFDHMADQLQARVQPTNEALVQIEDLSRLNMAVISGSPTAVLVYRDDGACVLANEAAARTIGGSIDRLLAQNFRELASWQGSNMLETAEKVLKTGESHHMVVTTTSTFGKAFVMEADFSRVMKEGSPHLLLISRDVTAQYQAEVALAESELHLRTIFEQAAVGVALIDSNSGRFLRVNQRYCDIAGYTAQEMLDNTFMGITHPDDLEADLANMARLRAGDIREFTMEKRYVRKDGSTVWVSLSVSPTWEPGEASSHHIAVVQDITGRKLAEAEAHSLAFFDPLTKLPNRRLLMDRLQQSMAASGRSARHRALLFLDLDNFKTLNDTQGHEIGDRMLIKMSERLQSCVREIDTVSRLGGDEFIVLLEQLDEDIQEAANHARTVGEKILASLGQPFELEQIFHRGTVSIGITLFRGRDVPIDDLMKRADLAMYQAKGAGRNTLRFFDPHMQATITARSIMENELHMAIINHEFQLHAQPQIDSFGRCVGVEMLLRWYNPNRGMVSPAEFIPLAEDNGQIVSIGRWVLEEACRLQRAWQGDPATNTLFIAVNVSAKQLRNPDFVGLVHHLIQRTGANPSRLKLEITESVLLDDVNDVIIRLEALKKIGVSLSLDDFGTGYSSLTYLKRLPLDQVKIDQSFVRDILIDPNDAAICRAIIVLGENLGLSVIAEGVETAEQWQLLISQGCYQAQGYYFARPMPANKVLEWLHQNPDTVAPTN
jgi:diguanylate cyclase (GGDEF)-like protein/PAS domain S-box-containing protein